MWGECDALFMRSMFVLRHIAVASFRSHDFSLKKARIMRYDKMSTNCELVKRWKSLWPILRCYPDILIEGRR
jgi:hypothetical protein